MPLWLAAVLLLLALLGILLSRRLGRPARTVCTVVCALLALACAVYIGLLRLILKMKARKPRLDR